MYIWRRNVEYFINSSFEDQSSVYIRPNQGSLIGKLPEKIGIWAKDDVKKIPDYFTCGAMNIVSKRLKEFLDNEVVSSSVEFFSLEVKTGKKMKQTLSENSFYLMNFLGHIDCFDLEHSIYKRSGEFDVRLVDKLVLDESKIPSNTKLFLIFPYILNIGVCNELAKKMIKENFKGIQLTKVEETILL